MPLHLLNESDITILRQLIDDFRAQNTGTSQRSYVATPPETHQDEVVMVLTPDGGIPALTPPGTGTGTSPDSSESFPGFAVCNICQIADDGSIQETENDLEVLNLSEDSIDAGIYITAVKERLGNWIAQVSSSPFGPSGDTISWIKCTSSTGSGNIYPGTLSKPTQTGWDDTSLASPSVLFMPMNPDQTPAVTPVVGSRYPSTKLPDSEQPPSGNLYILIGPIVKCDGQGNLQVG